MRHILRVFTFHHQLDVSITALDFSHNKIEAASAEALAIALKGDSHFVRWDMSLNLLRGGMGAQPFARLLRKVDASLCILLLSDNLLGNDGAVVLADAIQVCYIFSFAFLSVSRFPVSSCVYVTCQFTLHCTPCAFQCNSSLLCLDMARNYIKADGATALAATLQQNTTLRELHLECNELGNAGVVAMAQSLHTNSSLTFLSIHSNDFDHTGIDALATTLTINRSLAELDIDGCAAALTVRDGERTGRLLDGPGVKAVAVALANNSSITALSLFAQACVSLN